MNRVKVEYTGSDEFQALMTIYNSDGEIVKKTSYDNDIKFGHELIIKTMSGNIYSKSVVNDSIILKDDKDVVFEIKDIEKLKLTNIINRKIRESFMKIYKRILADEYKCIYLIASKGRFGVDRISSAPNKRDVLTFICELELDDKGILTEDSVKILDIIVDTQLASFNNLFLINDRENKLKIYYDDKVFITSNKQIIEHIKPKVDEFQQNYIDSINVGRK